MKKFGFGGKDSDEDSVRAGLFGRKKSPSSNDNPYAQGQAEDPYANANATPYQQARAGLPSGPRSGAGRPGLPGGPGPRGSTSSVGGPPPPYSTQPQPQPQPQSSRGYANEKVGNTGGYGAKRYDDNPPPSRVSARGPGGYGGLDGDLDTSKNALFGGAKERYVPPERKFEAGYGQSAASDASGSL